MSGLGIPTRYLWKERSFEIGARPRRDFPRRIDKLKCGKLDGRCCHKPEEGVALRARRRSFDCVSRDKTARDAAQDDRIFIFVGYLQAANKSICPRAGARNFLSRADLLLV
jgi:hypothetical protein